MNTSNSDHAIGNPNLTRINVQTKSSFNTLIILKKETDAQSSIIINDEIIDENNKSEEISSQQNSAEVIKNTCYENADNLSNTEKNGCHTN